MSPGCGFTMPTKRRNYPYRVMTWDCGTMYLAYDKARLWISKQIPSRPRLSRVETMMPVQKETEYLLLSLSIISESTTKGDICQASRDLFNWAPAQLLKRTQRGKRRAYPRATYSLEDATRCVGPGISAWLRTSIGCSLGAVTVPSRPLTRHRSGKTLWVLEGCLGRG